MTTFDAEQFLAKLTLGEFDGHLYDVLRKLSREQLDQVAAMLVAKRVSTDPYPGQFGRKSDSSSELAEN